MGFDRVVTFAPFVTFEHSVSIVPVVHAVQSRRQELHPLLSEIQPGEAATRGKRMGG